MRLVAEGKSTTCSLKVSDRGPHGWCKTKQEVLWPVMIQINVVLRYIVDISLGVPPSGLLILFFALFGRSGRLTYAYVYDASAI